jgi:membrane-associated protease RseP (regulator of RpoE activity)
MDPVVEIVRGGTPQLNKMIFSSFYNDPGSRKMVIVQDDDKFPSPRLCLLRRWPNFEGGFGFEVGPWKAFDEDVATALKVEEVKRHSPAEAGGLRRNDIIVEINGDNIEFKSFVPLVELLKEVTNLIIPFIFLIKVIEHIIINIYSSFL